MQELTVAIPQRLAEFMREMATEQNATISDIATLLLRRGYDQTLSRPVPEPNRGQPPDARSATIHRPTATSG